jgi:hypothetical protein
MTAQALDKSPQNRELKARITPDFILRPNTELEAKGGERLNCQGLGGHICNVVLRSNLNKANFPKANTFTHMMMYNIYVLGTIMRQGMGAQSKSCGIVSDALKTRRIQLKLPSKLIHILNLLGYFPSSNVFRFEVDGEQSVDDESAMHQNQNHRTTQELYLNDE